MNVHCISEEIRHSSGEPSGQVSVFKFVEAADENRIWFRLPTAQFEYVGEVGQFEVGRVYEMELIPLYLSREAPESDHA